MNRAPARILVTKPKLLKYRYELSNEGTPLGFLEVRGHFRVKAEASIHEESWSLLQTGFWKRTIEFKAAQRPYAKGKLRHSWSGKMELHTSANEKYTFKKIKWWKSSWAWYDEKEQIVIEYVKDYSFSKKQAYIIVHQPGKSDINFLTILGLFGVIINERNSTTAANS
jgi:hypothetical protein